MKGKESMKERKNIVTFQGNPLTLIGRDLKEGDSAPDFTVLNTDLEECTFEYPDETVSVIISVPSLDTPVCDTEAKRFNKELGKYGGDLRGITISMDLPFAQSRWCGDAGMDTVQVFSDHREANFGKSYGVLIKELRLLARVVFVIDRNGKIAYRQIVNEMTEEPDYDEVIKLIDELI